MADILIACKEHERACLVSPDGSHKKAARTHATLIVCKFHGGKCLVLFQGNRHFSAHTNKKRKRQAPREQAKEITIECEGCGMRGWLSRRSKQERDTMICRRCRMPLFIPAEPMPEELLARWKAQAPQPSLTMRVFCKNKACKIHCTLSKIPEEARFRRACPKCGEKLYTAPRPAP
jgi:hypothetical protein